MLVEIFINTYLHVFFDNVNFHTLISWNRLPRRLTNIECQISKSILNRHLCCVEKFLKLCSLIKILPQNYPKSRSKHSWQYGFSPFSLKVPLLSCFKQNEQTKCSGWNFRNMAVIHLPEMGLEHPAQSDPFSAWKCVSQ